MKSLIKRGFLNGAMTFFNQNLARVQQEQTEKQAGWMGNAALVGAGGALGVGGKMLYDKYMGSQEPQDYMAPSSQTSAFKEPEQQYQQQYQQQEYYPQQYSMYDDTSYGMSPQDMQLLQQYYGMYG